MGGGGGAGGEAGEGRGEMRREGGVSGVEEGWLGWRLKPALPP